MKQRWILIRNTVAAIGFLGTIGFGVAQATTTRAPVAPSVGCSSFACRAECAPFGGDLVPGGPGEPLRCACCG